jgi:hypothetical protein
MMLMPKDKKVSNPSDASAEPFITLPLFHKKRLAFSIVAKPHGN